MRLIWALLLTVLVSAGLALLAPTTVFAGPIIVLDPGHSGTSLTTIDPQTQIRDEEYRNDPETTNVFDVALTLKAKLEAAGYTVLLTKQNAMDTVNKRERADVANNSHAALAVSIHTSGHTFGNYGEIYVQTLTSYRENLYGQNIYFSDPLVASLSAQYGQIFLAERRKIEGSSVVVTVNSLWEVRGLAPGNIPMVQLFSKVPWLLCEAGVPSGGAQRDLYAQSLFNSIVACVPVGGPPVTPVVTPTRFEQTDERIGKIGTWGTFAKTSASTGSYDRSSSSDAATTIDFIGTRLDAIGMRGTTTGIVDVYLDGKLQTTLDLGSAVAEYQVVFWSTGELADGAHTVTLVRDPGSASGKYITLDAVDVVGTITSPRPMITSLDRSGGDTTGGTAVVITGTGFMGVTGVTFGGTPATITSVDSVHQQITAVAPASAPGMVQVQVTAGGGKTPDTASDDFTYAASLTADRLDQTSIYIVKSGTWTDYASTPSYGGSYGRSSTGGASATVYFTGTRLDYVAMKGTTTGIADIYLDGAVLPTATVDLAATSATYQASVWSTGLLSNGSHKVRIVRNPSSAAGKYLTLDGFDVYGAVDDPPVTLTRCEQSSAAIKKTGTWSDFTSAASSKGSYGRSSTIGASATIKFLGTRLDWIAMEGATTGFADVYLDGVKMNFTAIDLYLATATYKVMVWSTGALPYGRHTVKIVRATASATGRYLTLDAVDIWGTITP